jgi:lysophospholipase L1-like esterase
VNYQKLICWGDSQSFGARTYGCYPLYLVRELNRSTPYTWTTLNLSTNGHTARDLWFRLSKELMEISDVHTACILIGANDVGNDTPIALFAEYYRQILDALAIHGFKVIHCGEIPPIWPDSHAFFAKSASSKRDDYNKQIKLVVEVCDVAHLTLFPELTRECYVDPVHFNEQGNAVVANAFANSVVTR